MPVHQVALTRVVQAGADTASGVRVRPHRLLNRCVTLRFNASTLQRFSASTEARADPWDVGGGGGRGEVVHDSKERPS
jgi:hypothetical protein